MMNDFEIFIGTHGAAAIVFFLADDVNNFDIEGVGGTDNGTDVEVVLEIFDGNFQG